MKEYREPSFLYLYKESQLDSSMKQPHTGWEVGWKEDGFYYTYIMKLHRLYKYRWSIGYGNVQDKFVFEGSTGTLINFKEVV